MADKIADVYYEVGYKVNDTGLKKADGELKKVGKSVDGAKKGADGFGNSLVAVGSKVAGFVAVGATVVALGTRINNATNEFAKFDYQLAKVNAKGDQSAKSFKILKDASFEAGKATVFSATESAKGLEYMAMAGWSAVDSAKALPAVLDTAVVAGEDLALVSDIMTDTMTVFDLGADKATHFADVLAYSSNKSNTSISMMGEAMKYAGPPMATLGSTAEETAAIFMSMADGGIKASQAGTTLRTAALSLVGPSKEAQRVIRKLRLETKDSSGNFLGMTKIMERLEDKTKDMTNIQKAQTLETLFGKQAVSGMMVALEQGTAKINKNTQALKNNNGYARKSAEYMAGTLQGQILATASKHEALSLIVGEVFAPFKLEGVKLYNRALDELLEVLTPTEETLLAIEGSLIVVGNGFRFMGESIEFMLKPLKYIMDSKIFNFYKDLMTLKYPREFLGKLAFGEEGLKGTLADFAREKQLGEEFAKGEFELPEEYKPVAGAPVREDRKTFEELAGFNTEQSMARAGILNNIKMPVSREVIERGTYNTGSTNFSPSYNLSGMNLYFPEGAKVNDPKEIQDLVQKTVLKTLEEKDKRLMNQINPRRR